MTYTRMMRNTTSRKGTNTPISREFFSLRCSSIQSICKYARKKWSNASTLLRIPDTNSFHSFKVENYLCTRVSWLQCFHVLILRIESNFRISYPDTIVFIFGFGLGTKHSASYISLYRAAVIVRRSFLSECFSRGDKLIRTLASGCNLYTVSSQNRN